MDLLSLRSVPPRNSPDSALRHPLSQLSQPNMPTCRGYRCTSTTLIRAHIFPRGFAREMIGDHPRNLKISMDKVEATQHGVFDPEILCAPCDGTLGQLDGYGLDVCRRFPKEYTRTADGGFAMLNVDGDQFAKFVLSVLWRAAIASRREFRKVSLGPFEASACEVIFGAKSLRNFPAYQLLVARYSSYQSNFNPARNYTSPAPLRIEGKNGYAFALCGFRIIAKIDSRPLSFKADFAIVNGNDKLVGPFIPYHETPEGHAMGAMKRAELARSSKH
jgi:hypothetical protein